MIEEVKKFRNLFEAKAKGIHNTYDITYTKSKPPYYHYTNHEAALSILSSRRIKFTPYEEINSKEIIEPYEKSKQALIDFSVTSCHRKYWQEFIDRLDQHKVLDHLSIYIASFSREGDENHMWTTFGGEKGDRTGYSIGFNAKFFEEKISNNVDLSKIGPAVKIPIVYRLKDFSFLIKELITAVEEVIKLILRQRQYKLSDREYLIKNIQLELLGNLIPLWPGYVSDNYEEENEIRLFKIAGKDKDSLFPKIPEELRDGNRVLHIFEFEEVSEI